MLYLCFESPKRIFWTASKLKILTSDTSGPIFWLFYKFFPFVTGFSVAFYAGIMGEVQNWTQQLIRAPTLSVDRDTGYVVRPSGGLEGTH